jgi:hypothetical protein
MRVIRRRFLSIAAAAAVTPAFSRFARSQEKDQAISSGALPVFPAAQWEAASPVELGWSIDRLVEAYRQSVEKPRAPIAVNANRHRALRLLPQQRDDGLGDRFVVKEIDLRFVVGQYHSVPPSRRSGSLATTNISSYPTLP